MATYKIDPSHSEITFKVKHLMISNVKGEFKNFTAEINGEDLESSTVKATIDSSSIYTNNDDRDNHLKSADFFEAEKYPQLKFTATKIDNAIGESFDLHGDLTIKDVTKNIKLSVEFGGIAVDPYGNTKAGFTLSGKINRKDFGLTWSAVTEAGGVVVSDDVRLAAEIQLVQQA